MEEVLLSLLIMPLSMQCMHTYNFHFPAFVRLVELQVFCQLIPSIKNNSVSIERSTITVQDAKIENFL